MLEKGVVSGGKREVAFHLPAEVTDGDVHLCGDFNEWSQTSIPMLKKPNGDFEVRLLLEAGQRYRYRYWVDGKRWENDWQADDYVTNEFGGEDSALDT